MTVFHPPEPTSHSTRTVLALLLHEGSGASHSARAHWLTTHPVLGTPVQPLIGPGRLLSVRDKHELIETLLGTVEREAFAWSPPQVLAVSRERMAWYVPGRVRPMHFRESERTKTLRVPWPTLVFYVDDGTLSVCAVAQTSRPTNDTPLYHAPLMNVNAQTRVCVGSARMPDSATLEDMPAYEAAMYDTRFTHVNHQASLKLSDVADVDSIAHWAFWQRLARQKATQLPPEVLNPLHMTLSQWWSET